MPKPDLILLALEDSPILNLMDRALRAINYETAIAKNTQALARVLQENSPALLLIGEKYDGYDGLKIAREIHERFPTMPFLIYTEKAQPELIKNIFRLGMGGYLFPPLRTDDIIDAVESGIKNAQRVGDWVRREINRTTPPRVLHAAAPATIPALMTLRRGPTSTTATGRTTHSGLSRG